MALLCFLFNFVFISYTVYVGLFISLCVCVCVQKSTYLGINGRDVAAFMYPHLTRKVLSLSNTDLPNAPFSSNVTPAYDEGLLYSLHTAKEV
jgi:hypothetical protein